MEPTLYYLPFSPWSQKARAALRHHKLTPREHIYTPVVGELALRLRLRRRRGRVTVPVLFTHSGPLCDSWDIALYADQRGSGSLLIPEAKRAEILAWNEASERLLAAGRGIAMLRTLQTPQAAVEVLPAPVRALFGLRAALPAVRAFNAKYDIHETQRAQYEAAQREELTRLARALDDGRAYLLGELSYADFAMAVAIMQLRPLPETPMGPAMRATAGDVALAAEFPQLLRWRDSLYAQHPWH
jgi:glutathione S-transferase